MVLYYNDRTSQTIPVERCVDRSNPVVEIPLGDAGRIGGIVIVGADRGGTIAVDAV